MGTAPRSVVTAPITAPQRYGLLASLTTLDSVEDSRWEGGMTWRPAVCGDGQVVDPCQPGSVVTADELAVPEFDPFVVEWAYRCSTLTNESAEERSERAREGLVAVESFLMAQEFWAGAFAIAAANPNFFLADNAAANFVDLAPAQQVPLRQALAVLADELGDALHGRRGMIHATRATVALWDAEGMIRHEGGLLLDTFDNVVVADAGYDGSGPAAIVNGQTAWAYGTGLAVARRGPIGITGAEPQGVDRATNTWDVVASRLAAVNVDECAHVGIHVDLCATGCVAVGS